MIGRAEERVMAEKLRFETTSPRLWTSECFTALRPLPPALKISSLVAFRLTENFWGWLSPYRTRNEPVKKRHTVRVGKKDERTKRRERRERRRKRERQR